MFFARDKSDKKPPPPGLAWLRVTRLAEKQDHALGLVVDGEFVYFVTGGFAKAENAVKRVPTAGGPVETLASGDYIVSGHVATDDGFVYWTNEWPGTVMRVKKTGGGATTLLTAQTRPTYLALDDQSIYFATYAKEAPGGTIARVAKTGGAAALVAIAHPYIGGLVVDGQDCYWTSTTGLWKQPKGGGQAIRLGSDKQSFTRLVGDSHDLFFFGHDADPAPDFAVGRIAKSGGELAKLTPPAEWNLHLGISDSHVYFFQHGSGRGEYVLQRVAKAGGTSETVDVGPMPSGHIAISGGNAYFTDIDTVYRVPK